MKRFRIIAVLVSCCLLCSCKSAAPAPERFGFSELSEEEGRDPITLAVPRVELDEECAREYVGELTDFSSGAEMMYFAPLGGAVYYLYQHDVWTNMSKRWEILRQDIATGEVTRAALIEEELGSAFFSCAASDKAIYYSGFTENDEWRIMEFSPEDGSVSVLLSGELSPNDRIPVLTCRGGKLSWYDVNDSGKTDIAVFDTETGELSTAAEDVLSSNPFERTAGTAFAKDENGTAVVYYEGGAVDTGCASEGFSLIAADVERVMWSETTGSGKTLLYLYDGSGKLCEIPAADYMGAGIINSCFYFNERLNDGAFSSELVFADIGGKAVSRRAADSTSWAYGFPEGGFVGLCSDSELFLYEVEENGKK